MKAAIIESRSSPDVSWSLVVWTFRSNRTKPEGQGIFTTASNRDKCTGHGVSTDEIEALFTATVVILPDDTHSWTETRFRAIGQTTQGRHVFVVFTIRALDGSLYICPISARYMHQNEVESYEEENPNL